MFTLAAKENSAVEVIADVALSIHEEPLSMGRVAVFAVVLFSQPLYRELFGYEDALAVWNMHFSAMGWPACFVGHSAISFSASFPQASQPGRAGPRRLSSILGRLGK
jgi:hypothetical protein